MKGKQLNNIIPLLNLAKFIGSASSVYISRTGINEEVYDHFGIRLAQEYKTLLTPFFDFTLNLSKNICIIPDVQNEKGL